MLLLEQMDMVLRAQPMPHACPWPWELRTHQRSHILQELSLQRWNPRQGLRVAPKGKGWVLLLEEGLLRQQKPPLWNPLVCPAMPLSVLIGQRTPNIFGGLGAAKLQEPLVSWPAHSALCSLHQWLFAVSHTVGRSPWGVRWAGGRGCYWVN